MKLQDYYCINPEEKPLENLVEDGGFVKSFRTIAFVGDSLSSGEFEALNEQNKRSITICLSIPGGSILPVCAAAQGIISPAGV